MSNNNINQQEEIQITEVNSNASLQLSNITSDAEKLNELMDILIQGEDEESINISIGRSESLKREQIKSRPESRFSNQSSIRKALFENQAQLNISSKKSDNFQSFAESNSISNNRKISEGEINEQQFIQQLELQATVQDQRNSNNPNERLSHFECIKDFVRNTNSVKSNKKSNFQIFANEGFIESKNNSDFKSEASFTNNKQINETEGTFKPIISTNSYDSAEQYLKESILLRNKKYNMQSQFGELPKEQEYVCGCIAQNENEGVDDQKDMCNII